MFHKKKALDEMYQKYSLPDLLLPPQEEPSKFLEKTYTFLFSTDMNSFDNSSKKISLIAMPDPDLNLKIRNNQYTFAFSEARSFKPIFAIPGLLNEMFEVIIALARNIHKNLNHSHYRKYSQA